MKIILKKLKLENVRSYKTETIDFPLGNTLFEGDIGSGKSTILMSIEFILFGLGDEKGAALLRTDESEGSLSLIFDVSGREYTIHRRLTRDKKDRKKVSQTKCELNTPEGRVELDTTAMKAKVLEILNFNEPSNPRAESAIYRYAIFTPQEEMKDVINKKPEERLQTLRKAFRLEDYIIAKENSKSLSKRIKQEVRDCEIRAEGIPSLESKITELKESVNKTIIEVQRLEKQESEKSEKIQSLDDDRDNLVKDEFDLDEARKRIDGHPKLISDKNKDVVEEKTKINGKISDIDDFNKNNQSLIIIQNPTDLSPEELDEKIESLEKKKDDLIRRQQEHGLKVKNYNHIHDEGICPTCDRPANSEEFEHKIKTEKDEEGKANDSLQECMIVIKDTRELREKKKDYHESQKDIERNEEKINGCKEAINNSNNSISRIQDDLNGLQKEYDEATNTMNRLGDVSDRIIKIRGDISTAKADLKDTQNKISAANERIDNWRSQEQDSTLDLTKKKKFKTNSDFMKDYVFWINDYFIPTLEKIEEHRMHTINEEFNDLFQKFFSLLIEDDGKEARIDEGFTPLITQDGYEQDIRFLSGGEKTSVALAYRLALNSIVQKVSTGMKSNLLILDEPTDGFSSEQLGKVREVLDELECPQIIIVSHEKELDSFADQIFTVTKSRGNSKITAGTPSQK